MFSNRSHSVNLASAGLSRDFWTNVKSNRFAGRAHGGRGTSTGGHGVLTGTGGLTPVARTEA